MGDFFVDMGAAAPLLAGAAVAEPEPRPTLRVVETEPDNGRQVVEAAPKTKLRVTTFDCELSSLHDQWSSKLYSFTYSILRNREDAEDAVQTTFMNAFNALKGGEAPRNEGSWLFCIARNVCLNRLRTRQRKPCTALEDFDVEAHRGVEDELERHLHARALRFSLERLPQQQRIAIVMRELQGASYAEIADQLETTQGAVESLLFRARRAMARSLRAQIDHAGAPGTLRAAA